jgi:hypothetical protein
MPKLPSLVALIASALATATHAADLLPLKQGLYVPAKSACKGASTAEIVNYWGGKSSFGSAQATCTIEKVTRNGNVFTVTDKCADIRTGGEIVGGPTLVTIANPTSFTRAGETYRYCGTKVQF